MQVANADFIAEGDTDCFDVRKSQLFVSAQCMKSQSIEDFDNKILVIFYDYCICVTETTI